MSMLFSLRRKSPSKSFNFFVIFVIALVCGLSAVAQVGIKPKPTPDPLKEFQYRLIGPFRGGRVGAVEGVAGQPNVYYYASAARSCEIGWRRKTPCSRRFSPPSGRS